MTWRSPELLLVPLRVLPLLVIVVFLTVLHGPAPVTAFDWTLGLAVAALVGLAARFPLAASLSQSALLVALLWDGNAQAVMPMAFVLSMITLGELWIRHDGWQCWAGTAGVATAQAALSAPAYDPVMSTASILLTTMPPVLLGWYIRSVLRRAVDAERRRAEAVRTARAAERTAIARELHDLVAHHMASIAVQVGAARQTLGGANPRVEEALTQAHTTTRAALTDLKRLLAVLRDPATVSTEAGTAMAVPAGLPTAIAAAVRQARGAGIRVNAEVDEPLDGLDSMGRLAVLRVVQEGLTNVVKHAGPAAHAELTVRAAADGVRITITDDGRGARPRQRPGFGLVGMRERVELLGGKVITRERTPGWTLEVTIPTAGERP